MKHFTKDNLPPGDAGWSYYRKTALTMMVPIHGPFSVETREGVIQCEDGYLAIDSGGWPYPIAKDEQRRIYEFVRYANEIN